MENCRQILVECSDYFRICHKINYLLTGLLVPYREILTATSHSTTFDISMRPLREDQKHRHRFTR